MTKLLQMMGVDAEREKNELTLNTFRVNKFEAPYEQVKKMRASIYVLGPLTARYGHAKVSLPGGCAWGPRPVNLHIDGIKKLGAKIEIDRGYILARASRLKGAKIAFDVSSVGATGNVMMAAALAKGTTVIGNAATEPEITALAVFLTKMGARIDGIGTSRLEIEGVDTLHPVDERMIPDRIEAGTFLIAAAMSGSTVKLNMCKPDHLTAVLAKLEEAGAKIEVGDNWVKMKAPRTIRAVDVTTAIYPGFPTDMQAQWITLMSIARGSSVITDSIYFDRFKHVPELIRLGADIELNQNAAIVKGVKSLTGTKVMSTDLRASSTILTVDTNGSRKNSSSLARRSAGSQGRNSELSRFHLRRSPRMEIFPPDRCCHSRTLLPDGAVSLRHLRRLRSDLPERSVPFQSLERCGCIYRAGVRRPPLRERLLQAGHDGRFHS